MDEALRSNEFEYRRFTNSMILEYACRTNMWDLVCCLLGQGLQHFDVHPVLLASATLMSIIKKNELDKLTDAITLLEYIHSQFPLVMPRALSALLVAIKTKTVLVQSLISNPSNLKQQVNSLLDRYMGCRESEVEHTVHMDSYSVTLHAEACKRIWSLVSQVAGEGRDCLLQTELTFQRQQRLVEDLRSYLDAVTSRLPCRLYELAETYRQQNNTQPPRASPKLRDFSIRLTRCPLDRLHQADLPVCHASPPRATSPQCLDDDYDASESASQLSDLDGEEEGPRSTHPTLSGNMSSPGNRRQVDAPAPPRRRVGADNAGGYVPSNPAPVMPPHVTFNSPEFPPLWRRNRGRVERHVLSDSDENCVNESPVCVLQMASSQGSDVDQSEPDVPSTMENIALAAVGQTSKESIVSDTESGTSPGEKRVCLDNIHSILKRPLKP